VATKPAPKGKRGRKSTKSKSARRTRS
jgi:hypothetical protein